MPTEGQNKLNLTFSRNKDDLLNREEFVLGMTTHPVTAKLLNVKTIDALLETF